MREKVIEAAGNRHAKKLGWLERKFKAPGRRSAPDRIYMKNGHSFFIEYKRDENEEATPLQKEEHKRLRKAGMSVYVCGSRDEYEAAFEYENRIAERAAL